MAESARTRLITAKKVKASLKVIKLDSNKDPLDERFHGKRVKNHVIEFGALIGLIANLSAIYLSRYNYSTFFILSLSLSGLAAYISGRLFPHLLLPLWRGWMGFAKYLSLVTTPILLGIVWLTLVIPIGLLLRALGIKVLDLQCNWKDSSGSYWRNRSKESQDFKLLARQF